jgi:hypothetical protein
MRLKLAALFLVLHFSALAQQEISLAGKWLAGGNAELYVERIAGNTGRLVLILEPQAGYFFTNSWAAGLRLPLGFLSNSYQIAVQPFVRFYVPLPGDIKPFVEVNSGYEWKNNLNRTTLDVVYTERSWFFGARGGAAFFVNTNVSVDVFLYYNGKNTTWEDLDFDAHGTLVNQTFGLGAGFQIYF